MTQRLPRPRLRAILAAACEQAETELPAAEQRRFVREARAGGMNHQQALALACIYADPVMSKLLGDEGRRREAIAMAGSVVSQSAGLLSGEEG